MGMRLPHERHAYPVLLPAQLRSNFGAAHVWLDVTTGKEPATCHPRTNKVTTRVSLRASEESAYSVGGMEIAYALWTYSNGDLEQWGPTLEVMDVSREFQGHGIGTMLYQAMERRILEPFRDAFFCRVENACEGLALMVTCCNVITDEAWAFFKWKCGFGDAAEHMVKVLHWDGEWRPAGDGMSDASSSAPE